MNDVSRFYFHGKFEEVDDWFLSTKHLDKNMSCAQCAIGTKRVN
jgi:hypothetical protein